MDELKKCQKGKKLKLPALTTREEIADLCSQVALKLKTTPCGNQSMTNVHISLYFKAIETVRTSGHRNGQPGETFGPGAALLVG